MFTPNQTTIDNSTFDKALRRLVRRLRPVICSNPGLMSETAKSIVADLRNTFPSLNPSRQHLQDEANFLWEFGYVSLGSKISSSLSAEILKTLLKSPVEYQDLNHSSLGVGLAKDAPESAYLGQHAVRDVLVCPHLIDLANDPKILNIVRSYLGFEPIIDFYSAWHSYPGKTLAGSPQTLHRDKDCFRFCKLFLYLSDVDGESGPHVFLPQSHKLESFIKLFRASTNDSHDPHQFFIGGQRNLAPYLENIFLGKFHEFLGPAGSAFLVDTYGLHKGVPPRSKTRTVFQVLYTLLPYSDIMSDHHTKVNVSELPLTVEVDERFIYRNQLHVTF